MNKLRRLFSARMLPTNDRGITIIEAVISVALLAMVGMGVFTGTGVLMKVNSDSTNLSDESKLIQIFVESIKSDPGLNQIDFANDETAFMDLKKFPIGYSPTYLGPRNDKDNCDSGIDFGERTGCDSKCSLYIAYRISPLAANTPGLLRVKIQIYNFKKSVCGEVPLDTPDVKEIQFVTQAK